MILQDIDKSNWKLFRFDEICSSISEKVDPQNTDLDIYIGLEHLDKESLHINRYGNPDDVKGAKLRFYPGDVIFGKRRAYQRKAAVVDFDGFCSAHSLVLRANSEIINPKFFPMFIHSDTFMHRAIDISVGSLSPTINWGTLKKQEFLLPPKPQQEKISELLWTIENSVKNKELLLEKAQLVYKTKIENAVPMNYGKYLVLDDILDLRRGITYKSSDYSDAQNGVPLLNLKSIERGGGYNKDGLKYYGGRFSNDDYINNDELLLACTDVTRQGNIIGYPLHPSVYEHKDYLFTMDLAALKIKGNQILRDYLYYVFKSDWVHWKIFAWSPGTTVLHLNKTGFKKIKIPFLGIQEQKSIVSELKKYEKSIENIKFAIRKEKMLKKSLINEIFSS